MVERSQAFDVREFRIQNHRSSEYGTPRPPIADIDRDPFWRSNHRTTSDSSSAASFSAAGSSLIILTRIMTTALFKFGNVYEGGIPVVITAWVLVNHLGQAEMRLQLEIKIKIYIHFRSIKNSTFDF